MAVASVVEQKLKLAVLKRIKKLKKLRRRQRMWGIAGALCAILACAPLLMYVITGEMPMATLDTYLFMLEDWAVPIACVIVGMAGTVIFYRQYRRDKDKYDGIRAGAVALMQANEPVCECKWMPCNCKDDLLKEMNEKHDINLSY